MSKLPETRDLPHAEEGYDPARVEEAFAAFAERVSELESVAGELRAELRALRAERAAPRRPVDERWPVEDGAAAFAPDWVAAVPPPLARGPRVPRLALEGAFLLLVALLAGLADLSAAWIVAVMAAAWALVALAEWAAAARRARWRLDEIPPPLAAGADEATGPWDVPVVEATAVAAGPDPESRTIVAKLPAEPADEDEPAAEPEAGDEAAPRRGLLRRLRRRRAAVGGESPDPWET